MKNSLKYALWIKTEAKRLGFNSIGISKAGFLEDEAPRMESYLQSGYQGKMAYLENHFDKRLDPTKLVEGAKSVISLSWNYFSEDVQPKDAPKLSRYAYGKDYHVVLKEKLFTLLAFIQERIGEVQGRVFTDSAPVMERAWAVRSGLGWIGKNGLLILPQQGSYFFLSEIILDLDLEPDNPIGSYCGNCRRCIDACPTQAITEARVLNASRCISYLTIELKDTIPAEFHSKLSERMFGCDICQEVCPWNRFSIIHHTSAFMPDKQLPEMKADDWYELTAESFKNLFKESPVQRAGFSKLKDTLQILQKNVSIY